MYVLKTGHSLSGPHHLNTFLSPHSYVSVGKQYIYIAYCL